MYADFEKIENQMANLKKESESEKDMRLFWECRVEEIEKGVVLPL